MNRFYYSETENDDKDYLPVYAAYMAFFHLEKSLMLFKEKQDDPGLKKCLTGIQTGNVLTELLLAAVVIRLCLPDKVLPVLGITAGYFGFIFLFIAIEMKVFALQKKQTHAVDPVLFTTFGGVVTGASFAAGLPCIGIILASGAPPDWLLILINVFSGCILIYSFINIYRGLNYIANKVLCFSSGQIRIFTGVMLLQWIGCMALFFFIFRSIK